ncbi:MAG: PSD1 domain-containing protein [Bryobacterales bacterium]|nr:PSD1 domain-containing protein [Bryobacterales bacterium]
MHWGFARISLHYGCVLPAALIAAAGAVSGADKVSFNRDIRPIMSDTCFRCHGPDKSSRMANMRLDLREEALKQTRPGVTPIVPGQPGKSAIIQRIFASNPAQIMPPKYSHKVLTERQKETIRRWVEQGAEYEGHWAYLPVRRPAVPNAPPAGAPVRNPIDAFIQARLAKEGLKPSEEADRRTLLRRVTLDLTGLPPTPAEIQAFLKDRGPDAYEKAVDRLLASPRYAEKQAMYWLDAVRYADTCGFHGDNPVPAWPYRDYVLRAFRDNKPFDVFTREQLAGDLLPGAGVEQKIASAFNRLNRTSAEGGIQEKEYLAKYAADRVRTVSAVWMGSTMGCAECHDHKFDPFTARDFYSMKAFFADIRETGLVPDRGEKAWGALLPLPTEEQQQRREELTRLRDEARTRLDELARTLASRQSEWEQSLLRRFEAGELSWRMERPAAAEAAGGAVLTVYNDEPVESTYDYRGSLVSESRPGNGLVVASGPNPDNTVYRVALKPGAGAWTALGIEVVQDENLPGVRVARGADRFVLTSVEAEAAGSGPARKLQFSLATSSLSFPVEEHPAMAVLDGNPKTGWGVATYGEGRNPFLALRFQEKLATTESTVLTVSLHFDSDYRRAAIGRFRLALSRGEHSWPGRDSNGGREPEPGPDGLPPHVLKALRIHPAERTEEQKKAAGDHFLWAAPETQPLFTEIARLEAELDLLEAGVARVVVTEAVEPAVTRVLPRGNWMDDSGEIVEPAIPGFLGKLDTSGRATRLDLANWLVSSDNPLTARVFVNRLWRQFFGTGLSKVLDDLGSQGEWPAHPELLDWLAAEFMRPGWQANGAHSWDVKHVIRAIVTSHAYRQSSEGNPQLESKDPDNRLLARQSRVRSDAETVRDTALAASGLLVEKFGGPSVRPYQPDGYLATLNFPKREYSASRGEDLYRRSVYTHWQRTFLHPSLAAFDAPTREECTVNRVNSNTPLQALVLLNDPVFVEAARGLAQGMLTAGGRSLKARLEWAFLRALGRKPGKQERRILADLFRKSRDDFRRRPDQAAKLIHIGEAPVPERLKPVELAAMTTVARAILNLHETITRE